MQAVRGSESDVEAQEPWAGWLQRPQSHVLRLGRLDDDAARMLVRDTALGGQLPPDVVDFVLRHSECASPSGNTS